MKKYIGLEEMSNENCSSVFSVISSCGEISRKEIAGITGLSWGGMTKIVNKLFEKGYIVEKPWEGSASQGRKPKMICVNSENNFVIGLDVNRMGMTAYVLDLSGKILQEASKDCSFTTKAGIIGEILSFLRQLVSAYEDKNILAIGVSMQGILDAEQGISAEFPQCPDWKDVPIRKILEDEFQTEIFVEHDPNCILYSVLKDREAQNTLLLRMDSSVGMAVSLGGRILRGSGLLEVAHSIVVLDGKPCRCGKRGCLEAYTAACFTEQGVSQEAVGELLTPLTAFLYNMCQLFHVKKVILTGKLMEHKEMFEKQLADRLGQYCSNGKIEIEFVEETGRAALGAALIAVQRAIDQIKV